MLLETSVVVLSFFGMVCTLLACLSLAFSFAFFNADFSLPQTVENLPRIFSDDSFSDVPIIGISRKAAIARCKFLNRAKNRKSLWIVTCHVAGKFARQYDVIRVGDFNLQRRLWQIDTDDSYIRIA